VGSVRAPVLASIGAAGWQRDLGAGGQQRACVASASVGVGGRQRACVASAAVGVGGQQGVCAASASVGVGGQQRACATSASVGGRGRVVGALDGDGRDRGGGLQIERGD
jgi:hypothetical protein